MGGVAPRSALIAATSRPQVEAAIRGGQIVRLARGRYALPELEASLSKAQAVGGYLSHTSAALFHGWPVKSIPEVPHVVVPPGEEGPARI